MELVINWDVKWHRNWIRCKLNNLDIDMAIVYRCSIYLLIFRFLFQTNKWAPCISPSLCDL